MSRAFPLAGLLRLRHLQEDQAAAELARANARTRAAERRRTETTRMLAESGLPDGADALTFQASVAARAALGALATESQVALDQRQVAAESAGQEWSSARAVARALEILRERHDLEQRREADRAEQLVLDEAAARATRTDLHDPAAGSAADPASGSTASDPSVLDGSTVDALASDVPAQRGLVRTDPGEGLS